eukprot:CAMPEP_0181402436 /NCGR_PEP_ID=MMETSP1110-20121109/3174_1 /TAXON_ID=174948 /ORGANISM="Symbiodinium sp., Strain CCMP421" /LENGTH=127 /DNA_ID=CAMNT_0023524655 /DNA_START=238 /DNA_END=621 /DNA_ORIENTATION=+
MISIPVHCDLPQSRKDLLQELQGMLVLVTNVLDDSLHHTAALGIHSHLWNAILELLEDKLEALRRQSLDASLQDIVGEVRLGEKRLHDVRAQLRDHSVNSSVPVLGATALHVTPRHEQLLQLLRACL